MKLQQFYVKATLDSLSTRGVFNSSLNIRLFNKRSCLVRRVKRQRRRVTAKKNICYNVSILLGIVLGKIEKFIYSDISANENNSFRNHIR